MKNSRGAFTFHQYFRNFNNFFFCKGTLFVALLSRENKNLFFFCKQLFSRMLSCTMKKKNSPNRYHLS